MSTPQTPQPPPASRTQNGPCMICGQPMPYIVPTPRIFNEIDVSVLAISHPPSRCLSCKTIHIPYIHGINDQGVFEVAWQPAKANRSPIIASGDSQSLQEAIAQAQFGEKLKSDA